MKILIAEDQPALRVIFEDAFLTGAHDVQAIGSGPVALDFLRSWQPDVLVSDLALPGLTGEELAQAAAALPGRVRIILMSAERQRLTGARDLADAVLHKPFPLYELVRAVEGPIE